MERVFARVSSVGLRAKRGDERFDNVSPGKSGRSGRATFWDRAKRPAFRGKTQKRSKVDFWPFCLNRQIVDFLEFCRGNLKKDP